MKKKKYVYLITRDPDNNSRKIWVKEKNVIKNIETILESIQLSNKFLPNIQKYLKIKSDKDKLHIAESVKAHQSELEQVNIQMDRLTDLLINQTIDKEIYNRKFAVLQNIKSELAVTLEKNEGGDDDFINALMNMTLFLSNVSKVFKSSKIDVKRALVGMVFSNLKLNGEKLEYTLHSPLVCVQNVESYKKWLGAFDTIRTNYREEVTIRFEFIPDDIREFL